MSIVHCKGYLHDIVLRDFLHCSFVFIVVLGGLVAVGRCGLASLFGRRWSSSVRKLYDIAQIRQRSVTCFISKKFSNHGAVTRSGIKIYQYARKKCRPYRTSKRPGMMTEVTALEGNLGKHLYDAENVIEANARKGVYQKNHLDQSVEEKKIKPDPDRLHHKTGLYIKFIKIV